jgi:DnaJ-class molecular chaperone
MSTLRKAYRTASLEWHPDRWAAKDKSASQLSDLEMVEVERVFSWLNTAYRRVADRLREEKRARRRAGRAAQEI